MRHAPGVHPGAHEHHRTPFLLKYLRKKRWVFALTVGLLFYGLFLIRDQWPLRLSAPGAPFVTADIQFPFDRGQGLATLGVEDVILGVGMITASRLSTGTSQKGFVGDLSFDFLSYRPGVRIRIEKVLLVERTPQGEGRIFEPWRVDVDVPATGRKPGVTFPELPGKFPILWEGGNKALVYFVFEDLPDDLIEGDLLLSFSGDFPGKKRTTFYEQRLAFHRKEYARAGKKGNPGVAEE